ncbi:hypothetical protein HFN63_35570 [Rhizobium leguminosarum]|uniref:leucine zipper domain-containing protein n=1 Tax=Rhizobium leguminosarum TaxID=384 RepID=UPI001C94DB7B|nr:hypothetical protein [Rhizobium leguminosarum]
MNVHKNARLTAFASRRNGSGVYGRPSEPGSGCAGLLPAKMVTRWVERFRAGGHQAMLDRSSRPHSIPRQTGRACAPLRAPVTGRDDPY